MQKRSKILFLLLIVAAFALGYIIRGGGPETHMQSQDQVGKKEPEVKFWTCSMHPQIRQPGPGKCPICGMDLIPVSAGDESKERGVRELKLSPRAVKLAEIQTAPVERKFVTAEIRMDGKVDYDETRLSYITAWVPGRIERLYVDYTGVRVEKGDHLVSLYSPELITAQQELLLGLKMLKSTASRISQSTRKNVEAAREKLRLWGLTKQQIKKIERSGKSQEHMTIYSPIGGIVVHKNGFEGIYVDTATKIYTVADLSQVWVKLDAYESDLVWIRYGQEVEFETKACPGESFTGQITFIDPILNPKTRTVKVRVNVSNPEGKLKPDMFVSARVFSKVAASGRVMDPALRDKWICPMHPEIVKDTKGSCDICGMPLVTAESLGYVTTDDAQKEAPLVIPVSAPLVTGKRAVVYVAVSGKEGVFEGREIILGPRAGNYYLVKDGLREGERVVVSGNFKIDSALQILAKPSMMSPEGGIPATGHEHHGKSPTMPLKKTDKGQIPFDVSDVFKGQIDGLVSAYFQVHQALSHDSFKEAVDGSKQFLKALGQVDMAELKGKAHMAWMNRQNELKKHAETVASSNDIEAFRSWFDELSDTLYTVIKRFGTAGNVPIYRFRCPMAREGEGAYWLQNKTETENPYYGSAMFRCGSQVEVVSSGVQKIQMKGETHE